MTQTSFQAVSQLNTLWGNLKGNPNDVNWEKLENQAKNILDEYTELMEAIAERNLTEVRDACCDITVFTNGLAHIAGFDLDEDMQAVQKSNLSKFCEDEAAVTATVDKYAAMGIEVVPEGDFPLVVVRSPRGQVSNNGMIVQKNKILKSVSFTEPVFQTL